MFATTSSVAGAPPPLVRSPSAAAISVRNLFIGAIFAAFAIVFLLGFWVGRATKPEVHDDAEYVLGELKEGASVAWVCIPGLEPWTCTAPFRCSQVLLSTPCVDRPT